jgi:hypothetical protein
MLANFLLDTPLIVHHGMSDDEIEELWCVTYARAKMTQAFLDQTIDPETYLDFMEQTGIDGGELLDVAEENLEFAIKDGISLEL